MRDSRKSKNIFVIVTNKCNLHCVYCYEKGKNTRSANISKTKEVLSIEFADSKFESFDVIFHGGEPFFEYGIVRELCEWIWTEYPDKDIQCLATTNGTLLNQEKKAWLEKNKAKFTLILSLDGGRETHNKNRCNSFDKIDFAFFLRNWPNQRVKMTINPDGLSKMFEDILEILHIGFRVNPSLAMEVNWDIESSTEIFANELEKLIEYYLVHPDFYPCPMLDLSPSLLAYPKSYPCNKACGAGTHVSAYDVYGNRYPCHSFVTDLSKPYNHSAINKLFQDLEEKNGYELSPRCAGCFIFPHCEPCYGMNYSHRGDMGSFDSATCAFNKVRVKAAASMYGRMLLSGKEYALLKGKTPEEIEKIIIGIQNIQNELS